MSGEEEVKQAEVKPVAEPTQAEKTAQVKAEREAYKKYMIELEANVKRMRLETEEMELFMKTDALKKELNALQIKNQAEAEKRREVAMEAAEKAEKEITVVKAGKARKEEKTEAEVK